MKWRADMAHAPAWQMDKAMRMIGITPDVIDQNLGSMAAALAVLQSMNRADARRLPVDDEQWLDIEFGDIDLVKDVPAEAEDEDQDPTSLA